MKNKTIQTDYKGLNSSPPVKTSPPTSPNSPASPEAQPPLPQRNYGSDPFASVRSNTSGIDTQTGSKQKIDTSAPKSPLPPAPKSPQGNKHHGIFSRIKNKAEHLHLVPSKLRGSKEDLSKRTSSGSTGCDDVDGHFDVGPAGTYRHSPLNTPSPHMTPSPNMKRRDVPLPEIPKEYSSSGAAKSNPQLPKLPLNHPAARGTGTAHIYEDPQKILTSPSLPPPRTPEHHYWEYDVTGSTSRCGVGKSGGYSKPEPEAYDSDPDRCHSSPADLNRPVPLRQESVDNGYEEHYSSIPEGDFPVTSATGAEYAEPHIGPPPAPSSKVSSLLNQLRSAEDTEVYSVAGNTYGSLDLLNTQNRPQSDVTSSSTEAASRSKEPLYGRLSAGQLGKSTEYGGLYANTSRD